MHSFIHKTSRVLYRQLLSEALTEGRQISHDDKIIR